MRITFYLTSIAVARRISLQTLLQVSTMWVPGVKVPGPFYAVLLRQPTEKAGDLCHPLTSAEVTACIYHYMDMCAVVAQRTLLTAFIYFATEELPSNNRILLPTLGYKQANKLRKSLYYFFLRDFWCCPCPLPKVSVMKNLRDAETQTGSNESV